MTEYRIPASTMDLAVALRCEADRAEREKFPNVAERQRKAALHLENAEHHMRKLIPKGYRLRLDLVFSFEPAVNAQLQPEYRKSEL